MKLVVIVSLFLALNPMVAKEVNLEVPERFKVKVFLAAPESAEIVGRENTADSTTVRVVLPDDREGTVMCEVRTAQGKRLWSHDFGYNSSAADGNTIAVTVHPTQPMLLVYYNGYKWDHDHRLLLISAQDSNTDVHEYTATSEDIVPFLRKQAKFDPAHKYWIYPRRFVQNGVEFECIPQQLPERQSVHPFAQDQAWYTVTAAFLPPTHFKPLKATISHEGQ